MTIDEIKKIAESTPYSVGDIASSLNFRAEQGLPLDLQFFSDPEDEEILEDDPKDKPEDTESEEKEEKGEETVTLTQAQLDKMLADREKRALKDKEKAVQEAEKLAKMNTEQKREYELEKLKRENEELKASQNRFELGKTATAILAESGIVANDEILDFVVREDAEKTNDAVKAFTDLVNKVSDGKMKEKLKGKPPKKQTGRVGAMSKEDILNIRDGAERIKAIQENSHLFQ
ncbi:DUF4355 domain-containing protein [Amphibacillus sp. MSJ-3]|uniref:DUF4355 domain-containing protein n=1 Tax=Amphibacillus sp. MSJ-3 TaxID=2841505 RepID=UPI001C0EB724|nr:DUF4355 domain-containing protein [Amphibacillus sp. MSJ-3]MBU5594910.1 DUF4355 domain-containing protein [Amphibacillus sp. MSJ-3]